MVSIISSEAERLYPTLTIDSTHDALAQVYTSDDLQEAYMAGASRKPTDEEIKAAANAILCIAHRQQFYVQAYWDLIDQCWRYVATDEARTAIEAMDEACAVIEAIQGKATEE